MLELWIIAAIVAAFLVALWCAYRAARSPSPVADPTAGFSDDAVDVVAMQRVQMEINLLCLEIECNQNNLIKLEKLRQNTASEHWRMRFYLGKWINYYVNENKRAIKDILARKEAHSLTVHLHLRKLHNPEQ